MASFDSEDNGNIVKNHNNNQHVSITMPSASLSTPTTPSSMPESSTSLSSSCLAVSKFITPRSSNEDLSDYTDADESVSSAPTEFLAEFLSAVMLKDYVTALKYCKLILQYEPDNATAKEFYPLIVEKINLMAEEESSGSTSEDSNGNSSDGEEKLSNSSSESDSDATTASYSSLEDEEADDNQGLGTGGAVINNKHHQMVDYDGNGNGKIHTTGKSLGTTQGMPIFQSTSSDSESPTEPVSQPTIAQLRAKVVPASK